MILAEPDPAVPFQLFLLGPPRIRWRSEPWRIPRRQVRALFFRLSVANRPVSRSHLHTLLWPDRSDKIGRRNLSRLLTYLRNSLPHPDLLQVTPGTAALDGDQIWSDARALLEADLDQAVDDALTALAALQTGPFLAGFSLSENLLFDAWLAETQRTLDERMEALLATLIDRKEAAGDRSSAIRFARELLARDDLAEETHRKIIQLHAANGDRAAAQRQYEECVAILERELGVAPLPETRAAYQAALREEPSAAFPSPVARWAMLPTLQLPLAGRERAWQQVQAAADRLQQGGLILLEGEPGIGKSRLLQEFATGVDGLVLAGAAYEGAQTIPYALLLESLASTLQRPELFAGIPATWLAEALPLLPGLRDLFPHLPTPLPPEPEQVRRRRFEALAQLLLGLARHRPVWLFLDDLQWADDVSLAWLAFFLPRLSGSGVRVVATVRPPEGVPLGNLRRQARRRGLLAEILLEGLNAPDVERLLTAVTPTKEPPALLARRLQAATGGNPFFILETIRALLEAGQLQSQPTDMPLPSTVREAINTRLARLTPLARQVLEAAAILETALTLPLLAATAGRKAGEVSGALDELVAHQVMGTSHREPVIRHELLRATVVEETTFWRRQLLHRRAAVALSEEGGEPVLLAYHWEQARAWREAVAARLAACRRAADIYAYETALQHAARGLALVDRLPEPEPARLAFLELRLQIHQVLLRTDDWATDLELVSQLATQTGDSGALLVALESRLSLHALRSDLPAMSATAEEALALAATLGDGQAEARLRNIWGWHLADVAGRPLEGLPHLIEAVRLARDAADAVLHYRALCNLAFCLRTLGRCREALQRARQALDLTPPSAEPQLSQVDALREIAEAGGYLGRWEEARSTMRRVVEMYEQISEPWSLGAALYNLSLFSSAMGQHREAVATMERLVDLGAGLGVAAESEYGLIHRAGLVQVLLAAGYVDEAAARFGDLTLPPTVTGRARLDYLASGGAVALARGDWPTATGRLNAVVGAVRETRTMHFITPVLNHALAAHRQGDDITARESMAIVDTLLEDSDCVRNARLYHFTRYQVTGDSAALAAARSELRRQAELFTHATLRETFLTQVQLNRDILKEARA